MPLWVGILLGVLTSAAIGAALCIWREYDEPTGGAVMCALLGPVGWLIILCSRDDRPVCDECGDRMVRNSKRCRHCGVERPLSTGP